MTKNNANCFSRYGTSRIISRSVNDARTVLEWYPLTNSSVI